MRRRVEERKRRVRRVAREWGVPLALAAEELAAFAAASPTRLLRLQRALPGDGSATAHGDGIWPHTIVMHAADDNTVPVRSAREFVGALRDAEGEEAVEYQEYAEAGHGGVMISLMGRTPLQELPEAQARITQDFVRRVVG
eukprot:7382085-Prymnesium_polylepis.1